MSDTVWGLWNYLAPVISNAQAASVHLGSSSGTMISPTYAITAAHVPLDGNNQPEANLTVTNIWGETVAVKRVIANVSTDFAIVELDHAFTHSYSAKIATSDAKAGDTTFIVGNPVNVQDGGLGWAVSFGTAYAKTWDPFLNAYDMQVYNGYSGGGIFNASGELLGVLSGTNPTDFSTAVGTSGVGADAIKSPYFIETSPIHNVVMDYVTGQSALGVGLSYIKDWMTSNNVVNTPGGDPTLPANQPDAPKVEFVSATELAKIDLVDDSSRLSSVAITKNNNLGTPDIVNGGFSPNGSGVLIASNMILTNAHVVEGYEDKPFTIWFAHGEKITGTVFAVHSDARAAWGSDLAIIKLDQNALSSYPVVQLATNQIDIGETAYIVGNPGVLWLTEGGWQVSAAKGTDFSISQNQETGSRIELKSTIESGNSGGGIFDLDGKLIGLAAISYHAPSANVPGDYQDPHATAYNPTAYDPYVSGPDLVDIRDFLSPYITVPSTISLSPTHTYTLTAASSSVNEDSSAIFNLLTTNINDGTDFYYIINGGGLTAADVVGGLSGKTTVTNNKATINIPVVADYITEGIEGLNINIALWPGDQGAGLASAYLFINDTSTSTTPVVTPTYTLTAASSSVNEGSSAIFNLVTTNVTAGTVLPYTLSGTGITAADITGSLAGSTTIGADGKATISVSIAADHMTEGAETLNVSLNGNLASTSITINDTSLTPVVISVPTALPTSRAKIFMGGNDDAFTASNSGMTIYGGMGNDTVTISNGATLISLDQNIEQINFSRASSSYAFHQTGNMINVYELDYTTLIAKTPVQGDSNGTLLTFSDGTASVMLVTGVMDVNLVGVSSQVTHLSLF
jgi:S1-C subfamily serine protease